MITFENEDGDTVAFSIEPSSSQLDDFVYFSIRSSSRSAHIRREDAIRMRDALNEYFRQNPVAGQEAFVGEKKDDPIDFEFKF